MIIVQLRGPINTGSGRNHTKGLYVGRISQNSLFPSGPPYRDDVKSEATGLVLIEGSQRKSGRADERGRLAQMFPRREPEGIAAQPVVHFRMKETPVDLGCTPPYCRC